MNTCPNKKGVQPGRNRSSVCRDRHRRGVTLMEVIFAIGIILTGLVGLTALIPVAASNAQATIELDRSISESTSSAATGLVQAFNQLDSLVIFDKAAAGSTGLAFPYWFVPSRQMRTIGWKTRTQSNYDPPFTVAVVPPPRILIGKLETPGYGHHALGSGLTAGICIDPLGMPDPSLVNPSATVNINDSAFDYSRFPYYGERYRVLVPPNDAIDANGSVGAPTGLTPQWPMGPRMWRATLKSPLAVTLPLLPPWQLERAVARHQLRPAAAIRSIFRGSGGLSPLPGAEPDDPRSVLMSQTVVGGSYVDSARDVSSSYTWFVTLAPPFLGGNTFRQSIVVVRQRQSAVPTRANDPLALQQNSYTVNGPEENPSSERLAWVGNWLGFNGGAGGEVLLHGSQAVSDEIEVGQWVMMSRQPHNTLAVPIVPTGPAVHRWYRVLRVGESEMINGLAWPGGGAPNVWRRWVALAGPDWAFEDGVTTPVDDTFCTIVTGAVSVVESEVVIQ